MLLCKFLFLADIAENADIFFSQIALKTLKDWRLIECCFASSYFSQIAQKTLFFFSQIMLKTQKHWRLSECCFERCLY